MSDASFILCSSGGGSFLLGGVGSVYVKQVLARYCRGRADLVLRCWVVLQLRKLREGGLTNIEVPQGSECPSDLMKALEYLYEVVKGRGQA